MRLSLRFIVPLLIALTAFAYALMPIVEGLTRRWFLRDLDLRAQLIASTVSEPLRDELTAPDSSRLVAAFESLTQDERLYAVGFCPTTGAVPIGSTAFPAEIRCGELDRFAVGAPNDLTIGGGLLHVTVSEVRANGGALGYLVLVHDITFIDQRSEETRRYLIWLFIGLAVVVSLVTVVIAQLSWRGWVQSLRALMRGETLLSAPSKSEPPELRPVASDLRALIRDIEEAHQARGNTSTTWTPETLRAVLNKELRGQEVIVVANREPYLHDREPDGSIVVRRPASGLVTALEPIMRACSGTWIAHGNGSADRDVVDADDHVQVPPEDPSYQLRRVWLTGAEEQGYYYGFANEGMWPLCHIAHIRPTFRTSDWEMYRAVNRRFAEAVVEESRSADPIVLVQDYHFALLPRMIREALPAATIITFWHIPWPNPDAFAICPWRHELLDGLLGSSILGFHTQAHCNNFVDTVDRQLEARVDRDAFTVSYLGEPTAVKRYPISIAWPIAPDLVRKPVSECRADVRRREGLPADHRIGIGVDRLDYTKGIEERFRAVERLFELYPEWIGRFSFVQIAAPSRSSIDEYHGYQVRVRALAQRINDRFTREGRAPIILKVEHHEPDSVYEYYRASDLCFVSSLHDGMNLVAKEFVGARDDERGVLVLSRFAGAARELPEALVVNPYDADECATALHLALGLPEDEQRDRMRLMRSLVRDFNVFRWAGRMLMDASGMRRHERIPDRTTDGAT
ncbi:MAG TPA: trehalose-6-phosphate synthase [Gemmatimonadaceae bacterium]|nr:trehalose-6-phosphate synthase [Gemmatimonadaceae bacterium]